MFLYQFRFAHFRMVVVKSFHSFFKRCENVDLKVTQGECVYSIQLPYLLECKTRFFLKFAA